MICGCGVVGENKENKTLEPIAVVPRYPGCRSPDWTGPADLTHTLVTCVLFFYERTDKRLSSLPHNLATRYTRGRILMVS